MFYMDPKVYNTLRERENLKSKTNVLRVYGRIVYTLNHRIHVVITYMKN